jgi:hypothetical protein
VSPLVGALPVLSVRHVASMLHMSVDGVYRMPRTALPYMHRGAGKYRLYLLEDVIAYVRRCTREQSADMNSKARQQLIGEIIGSARGRSRKGTSS